MTREDEILTAAMELPEPARARLADQLLRSLDEAERTEIDVVWAREAESRINAYERGEIEAIPGEEVFDAVSARRPR